MPTLPPIQFLPQHLIDKRAWDACIDKAANGLIYAYSWYLDAMSTAWDGLVLGDYGAVMPLPYRKKWRIQYLYQPFLTAQLGLFGTGVDKDLLEAFLEAIPKGFKYWDFSLNSGNVFTLNDYPLRQRTNFVLDLSPAYDTLASQYRENTKRNIKRSHTFNLQVKKGIPVAEVISLNQQQSAHQKQTFSDEDYNRFKALFSSLQQKGQAETYGVYSPAGELTASVAFVYSHNRAYYLLVGNHPNSRALGASHRLVDAFIFDHAGSPLLLDFEGSDIPSLAFFYGSFGATPEPFCAITLNRLPWYIKWLKK
jgi:hypothetical protein